MKMDVEWLPQEDKLIKIYYIIIFYYIYYIICKE